jgi:hypothetical protein
MGYKETLEELIDEYEEDEPFLTVGARAVLATYRRLLEEEAKDSGGGKLDKPALLDNSVRGHQVSRRRTR